MNFVALDVETANSCLDSICQIGAVVFDGDNKTRVWQTLVNPRDDFDAVNVSIHGISKAAVKNAPCFPAIFAELCSILTGTVVAHLMPFDRTALARATLKHGLTAIECCWLDTAKVVRRAWPEFSRSGYGLANVAKRFGIEFQHHCAHEDARAAGEILRLAIRETGITIADWLKYVDYDIPNDNDFAYAANPRARRQERFTCAGNAEGPLFGETIVFTGSLSIQRRQAVDLAAKAGCNVADSVTKITTLLVVGDQDLRLLAGHDKSGKHRKAESLIEKGQAIRIIGESDFVALIGCNSTSH
jgi:DNA polymerase III subunit epsilon